MTDEELHSSWPDLGAVVTELRRMQHTALADRLVDAVQYASTSGEIYDGIGAALQENHALREHLGADAAAAWGRVIDTVDRAFARPPVRSTRRSAWLAIASIGLVGLGAAVFLIYAKGRK